MCQTKNLTIQTVPDAETGIKEKGFTFIDYLTEATRPDRRESFTEVSVEQKVLSTNHDNNIKMGKALHLVLIVYRHRNKR